MCRLYLYSTCILTVDYLNFNRRKVDNGGVAHVLVENWGKFYNWSHTSVKHFRLNYDWYLWSLFIHFYWFIQYPHSIFDIHFYLDLLFNNSLDIESPLHKKRVQSLCDLELPLININPFILTIETFILPTSDIEFFCWIVMRTWCYMKITPL